MHGLSIAIIILVLRVVFAWSRGQKVSIGIHPAVRMTALRTFLGTFAFAMFVPGDTYLIGWVLLCVILPEPIADFILIPSGIPHVTYWYMRVAYAGGGDGEAAFHEMRARLTWGFLLASKKFGKRHEDLFDDTSDQSIRGASISALALRDAISGDVDGARELFRVAQTLYWMNASWFVRRYAQAWLLVDAARRSAYHEIVRIAASGPFTARRLFMKAVASRLLGAPDAPRPFTLAVLWATAPSRRSTWPLLRCALRAKERPQIVVVGHGLEAARQATIELLRLPPGVATRDELRAIAGAWQRVFDRKEIESSLEARKEQFGTFLDVKTVAARFEGEVIDVLASVLRDTLPDAVSEEADPPLLVAAKDQIQFELLGEIESLCLSLPRGDARSTFDYEEHWRAWARVRALSQQFFDVLPERKELVFDAVGVTLLNHGAWLYNKEFARVLSHDVFRWLYSLAPRNWGDFKTIRNNVRLASSA